MTNDEWRLECDEKAMPHGHCLHGVARLGEKGTKFCVAGNASSLLFLLVDQTPIGLELVREFEQRFGRSTLLYMFDCGGVKGYWAEWHFHGDNELLSQRVEELKQGRVGGHPDGHVTFLRGTGNYVI